MTTVSPTAAEAIIEGLLDTGVTHFFVNFGSDHPDIIEALARGEGPARAMVALGYAGWGAGQLEDEVLDNAWLSGPFESAVIFDLPFEERWARAASLMGVDLERLSGVAGHA